MRYLIAGILCLFFVSCKTVQYVPIPVPYMPEFSCPPVVRPELRPVNTPGLTQEEREQARRYNLNAVARYVQSLRNHIECLQKNIDLTRKEAERMKKEILPE